MLSTCAQPEISLGIEKDYPTCTYTKNNYPSHSSGVPISVPSGCRASKKQRCFE